MNTSDSKGSDAPATNDQQQQQSSITPPAPAPVTLQQLQDEINSLISLTCTDTSQCKSGSYGFNGCGGETNYVIWSTLNTNVSELQTLMDEYTAMDTKQGGIGACIIIAHGPTACVDSQCKEMSPTIPH